MTSTSWTVRVEWRGTLPEDDRRLDKLIDLLAPAHGALSHPREDDRASAHVTIDATTLRMATDHALRIVGGALRDVGLPFTPVGLEVLDTATADARLADPVVPPLMSTAQIAERAGVTRQRVGQWIAGPDFPRPVTDPTERQQFWTSSTIERWLATHERTPGRPPATAAARG